MRHLSLIAVAGLAFIAPAVAAPPKKPAGKAKPEAVDPFIKNTIWTGMVAAVNATSISVTSDKALTRQFSIYSGTIIGPGAKGTLSDLQVGGRVIVSFSEVPGSNVAKAENISPPKEPKVGAPRKKKKKP